MTRESPGVPGLHTPPPAGSRSWRDLAYAFLTADLVLALLYVGRGVLIPLTLAMMLSLLLAPLVRLLRRIGLGRVFSVLAAILVFILAVTAIATALGTQALRMASSLPQYQQTFQQKLRQFDAVTVGRLAVLTGAISRVIDRQTDLQVSNSSAPSLPQTLSQSQDQDLKLGITPMPVQVYAPHTGLFQLLEKVVASVWPPLETAGIVLMVLVFVLLDHEALRDRFIRLSGGHIRLMTLALNDAGERLSRFFVSQFAVNAGVGIAVGLGLGLIGLPQAALWGTLAAALRFVPYIGIWIAAAFATTLALVLVPGWALAVVTLGLFVLVELIAGQLVEPNLYGHATGLSAVSVVIAAIFWSALWGPIGLILSTPLTLCLVVIGRHIEGLEFLEVLLGDNQALTLPQKFYQRALSGDSHEILGNAYTFLKSASLAEYCDRVLMPALHLALLDHQLGAIDEDQEAKIREVIIQVVGRLAGGPSRRLSLLRRAPRESVLERLGPGRALRRQREQSVGKWQGPVAVAPGSVIICLSLGSPGSDLAAEILVRILRDQKFDARNFSVDDMDTEAPTAATPDAVAIAYLVSALPHPEPDRLEALARRIHRQLPGAAVINVLMPRLPIGQYTGVQEAPDAHTVTSFARALQVASGRSVPQPTNNKHCGA